ncbi:MAG TPA: magnesium transporter [Actinomycetota bacterium]|nr:magnesium transporter [Actinomycetota bacterium]
MALAPRRRARRVFRYWRSEQRTLRQGYAGLLLSSGGDLLAGLVLAFMTKSLDRLPGLFVLIPAAIGMRGNVFGALGSRLGTGVHSGVFEPTRARRGFLGQNVYSSIVLTLSTSLFLAVAARVVAPLFSAGPVITLWDFVMISVLGGALGSLVVGTAAVVLAVLSFRHEWDIDSVSAPVVTAMGDIATLPALWAVSFLVTYPATHQILSVSVGAFLIVVCLVVTIRGVLTDLDLARRIVRESIPVLCLAGLLDILAGSVLDTRFNTVFAAVPALLILVPPFLEDTNALNGILSSRLASKLHLGLIEPKAWPQPLAFLDMSIQFVFAVSVFTLVGLSSQLVAVVTNRASPGLVDMLLVSLIAGFLATIFACAIAYYGAVATFRFGLDPDNHGIPLGSSLMDLVGSICLILVIAALGIHGTHV